jgi:seryl-tRNA synthetase
LGGVGNSQRCPICKVEAQEEKIKPVPTLESAVISWQDAREEIFRIIERSQSLESQLNELRSLSSSNSKSITEEATSKQKKTAHTSSQQQSGKSASHHEPKTRAQKAKLSAKRKSQDRPTQAGDSDDDGIEVLDHNPTDRKHLFTSCAVSWKREPLSR